MAGSMEHSARRVLDLRGHESSTGTGLRYLPSRHQVFDLQQLECIWYRWILVEHVKVHLTWSLSSFVVGLGHFASPNYLNLSTRPSSFFASNP